MSVIGRIERCVECKRIGNIAGHKYCYGTVPNRHEKAPWEWVEVVAADDYRGLVEVGDALADAVSDIMADDPGSVLHTWSRRWRDAVHPRGQ